MQGERPAVRGAQIGEAARGRGRGARGGGRDPQRRQGGQARPRAQGRPLADRGVLRMRRAALLLMLLAGGAIGVLSTGSEAATPAQQSVTAPTTPGQKVTKTWTGTIPFVSDGLGTSSCKDRLTGVDRAGIHIDVPAGAYDNVDIEFKFTITWTDQTGANDEV